MPEKLMRDAFPQLLSAVNSYAKLGANWDSYNAGPIDPAALKTACELLGRLQEYYGDLLAPSVSPTNWKGVSLLWTVGAVKLEVEIYPAFSESSSHRWGDVVHDLTVIRHGRGSVEAKDASVDIKTLAHTVNVRVWKEMLERGRK